MGREPGSWTGVNKELLYPNNEFSEYLSSLYWSCTVFATVGYGDIIGNKTIDLIFTMVVFVFL